MAFITCTFRSQNLEADTTINVFLPDGVKENIPTLYLLHGMHGNFSSWMNKTSVARYAQRYGIAVVMASAENSFYSNMKYGYNYYDFFTKELIDFTRQTFRLSADREKTYVAGLSMGGYGALKLALRNPDLFCAASSLSGCLDINQTLEFFKDEGIAVSIWGENYKNETKDTEDDLFHLIRTFPKEKTLPKLYIACGETDFLIEQNRSYRDFLAAESVDFKYEEGEGAHTWEFWDKWILPAIDFMTK